MKSDRMRRVDEAVREVLSDAIATEIKDPRVGFVTVTAVDTAPDLRHAKVFVSVLGSEEEAESTLAGMTAARSYLRRELSHRLNSMHHIPEINFRRDTSIERGARMSAVLDELARERNEREAADGG